MSTFYIFMLTVAGLILAYLFIALLFPEKFS